jgi:hypothetical protein
MLLREDVADEIVLVQPLHDDDNHAVALVIMPAVEGMVEPVVGAVSLRLGQRLLGLQRIVDNDDVGAAAGQHTAGRGGEPVALPGGDELLDRLALRRQAGREDLPVPRADHDAAAIAGELVGQILTIAGAEELDRRVVPERPGGKRDRGDQGFKVPRRQIDDQPPDPAATHLHQLGGDDLDMPVHRQLGLRIELMETARDEGREVLSQQGLVLGPRQMLNHRARRSCDTPGSSAARSLSRPPR